MQIGWVDFSKTERDKVVSILRLLGTQTALDELGIGTVRDAFSDMFFPGISTLQTRAKYFVIPYLFAQAENHRFKHRRDVLAYIHNEEFTLVKTLVKNSGPEAYGIVGSRNMEKMVKMKPSSIYWNGLRTVGILRYPNISLDEACEIVLRNERIKREVTLKTESADEAADDTDALAGKTVLVSPIVPDYDVQRTRLLNLPKKRHSTFTIISLIVQRLAIPSRRICCVKKFAFLPSGKSPMRRYQVTLAMPFIWRRNLRSSFMARIFFTTSFTQMDVVSMTMK